MSQLTPVANRKQLKPTTIPSRRETPSAPSSPSAKTVQEAAAATAKTLVAAAAKNTAAAAKATAVPACPPFVVVATKAAIIAAAGLLVASAAATNDTSNHLANSTLDVMEDAHDKNIYHHIQQSTHDTLAHCMLCHISLKLST